MHEGFSFYRPNAPELREVLLQPREDSQNGGEGVDGLGMRSHARAVRAVRAVRAERNAVRNLGHLVSLLFFLPASVALLGVRLPRGTSARSVVKGVN